MLNIIVIYIGNKRILYFYASNIILRVIVPYDDVLGLANINTGVRRPFGHAPLNQYVL